MWFVRKEIIRFVAIIIMILFYYGTDYFLEKYVPSVSPEIRKTTGALSAVLVCILLIWLGG